MNKEQITQKSGICLMILIISGETLAVQTAQEAGQDLWLAVLVALILAIPVMALYGRLLSLFPDRNLFDISELVLGKYFGKFLNLIFLLYLINLGASILGTVGRYITGTSMPETPVVVPLILVILLSVWAVKEGIEVLGRWANIFVLFNAPLPSILILLLIPHMDFLNILPILKSGYKDFLKGVLWAISSPFTETIMLVMAVSSLKPKNSYYKIFIMGTIIGGILIVGVSLTEILVIGDRLYSMTYFPNHAVAKNVSIGQFLHRQEILTIIATSTSIFLKLAVCLLGVCNGIAKLLNFKDYRFITLPMGLIFLVYGYILANNPYHSIPAYRRHYTPVITIILPLILWIIAEARKKKLIRNKT